MKRDGSRSLFSLLAALLPGLAVTLLTFARFRTESPLRGWEAFPLLISCLLLAVALVRGQIRRGPGREGIPAWSLPALGYLLVVGIPLLGGLLSPGTAGEIFNYLWLLLLTGAAFLLLARQQRREPLPLPLWLLLGIAFLAQPVMVLFAGLLLLPAALALWLAPTHGARAALMVAPALYWPVDAFFDPAYGLAIWSEGEAATIVPALTLLPALLLLLVLPAGLVLATTRDRQLLAILPVPLLLLAGELWRNAFFAETTRGAYTGTLWLTRLGGIAHVTLLLLWVVLACRHTGDRPDTDPTLEDEYRRLRQEEVRREAA